MKKYFFFSLFLCLYVSSYAQVTIDNMVYPVSEEPRLTFTATKTNGTLATGDNIGSIYFQGALSVARREAVRGAAIRSFITGDINLEECPANILFQTGSRALSNRMIITENGDIGINTDAPTAKFHVVGSSLLDGPMYLKGKIGIGTDTPLAPLHVVGDGILDGSVRVQENMIIGDKANYFSTSSLKGYSLAVVGKILAEGLTILPNQEWENRLSSSVNQMSIDELDRYIAEEKKLPSMPSMQEEINVNDLLQSYKIELERLTKIAIEQEARIKRLENQIETMEE